MFDVESFFSAPKTDAINEVKHGTETFRVKRMNGIERSHWADIESTEEALVYVLSKCLLTGENDKPIGEENAYLLVEKYEALARALYADIREVTEKCLKEEALVWAVAKKNTKKTRTATKSSDDDTADDME